jgi:hypothetical protein
VRNPTSRCASLRGCRYGVRNRNTARLNRIQRVRGSSEKFSQVIGLCRVTCSFRAAFRAQTKNKSRTDKGRRR